MKRVEGMGFGEDIERVWEKISSTLYQPTFTLQNQHWLSTTISSWYLSGYRSVWECMILRYEECSRFQIGILECMMYDVKS